MKKIIFLFLLVFLFALTACGSDETKNTLKSSNNTTLSKKAEISTSTTKTQTLFADKYEVKINSGGQEKVTITYDKSRPGTPTVEVLDESICKASILLGNLTIKGQNYGNTKVFVRFNGEEIVINVSVELTSVEAEVSLMNFDSFDVYCILNESVDLTPRVILNKGSLSGGTYKIINKNTSKELNSPIININSNEDQEFIITPLYTNYDLSEYSQTVKVHVLNTFDTLDENCYRYIGRYNDTNTSSVKFENVNSGIEISFFGTSIKFTIKNEGSAGRVKAIVDGNMFSSKYATFPSGAGTQDLEFNGLDDKIHTVRIINVYEDYFNPSIILSSVQAPKFVE